MVSRTVHIKSRNPEDKFGEMIKGITMNCVSQKRNRRTCTISLNVNKITPKGGRSR